MDKVRLIATSTFGLEAMVKRELSNLGFYDTTGADGRVEFDANLADIPRLNINLRTADRVLLKIGEFKAFDFGELFDGTKVLPWEDWIPKDGKINVSGKCVKSTLMSVRSCQSIVKKAIVDRLKDKLKTDLLPESGLEFGIQVAMLKDAALLTLDTSGAGLHKRGYRTESGEVPMRENLAAALVMLSSWKKDKLLIDPMCGSGTILIEAAMIARNIAPGLKRKFASEDWPKIEKKYWDEARKAAREAIKTEGVLNILGFDIDPDRIRDCKINAKNAGVDKDIVFEEKDIRELRIDKPSGYIISNPPYGVEMGTLKELTHLYILIHNMFRKKLGWAVYIITADKRFPDFFKRAKPDRVRKLFNGGLEVNYYQYFAKEIEKKATSS